MSTDISIEESQHISFSGTDIIQVRPISTINIITPFERHITGCNKVKCPCRIWTVCSYYNKIRWKKSNGDEDEHTEIIWDYYNNIFRISYMTPDIFPNG